MRQGDLSDEKLYLIFSGSVLIFINKDLDFNNADLKQLDRQEKKDNIQKFSERANTQNLTLSMVLKLKDFSKKSVQNM